MPERSSIVTLPDMLEVLQRDYDGNAIYARVWQLVACRKIRVQKHGRQYRLDLDQTPVIAEALELRPRVAAAA